MSIEGEFGFIGHCFNPEEHHDKVWGYFYRPTPNANTWTRKSSGWNCCVFGQDVARQCSLRPMSLATSLTSWFSPNSRRDMNASPNQSCLRSGPPLLSKLKAS